MLLNIILFVRTYAIASMYSHKKRLIVFIDEQSPMESVDENKGISTDKTITRVNLNLKL